MLQKGLNGGGDKELSNRMTTPENKTDIMEFDAHLITDFADIHYFGDIQYALYSFIFYEKRGASHR